MAGPRACPASRPVVRSAVRDHSVAGRDPYGQPQLGTARRKTRSASTIRGLITPPRKATP
ncbi:hypothetical protein GCM10018780_70690 [Streptomyces lanatus]|nr:hypothetical protein GCM10018780_70690 [Streptomyces lanatus]